MKKLRAEKEKKALANNSDMPSLDENNKLTNLSRKDALKENERVFFENENISGSISLKGATIDDLVFKNYKIKLEEKEKVVLLNPRVMKNGYFLQSGFVTNSKNIQVPNSSTIWSVVGNNKLTHNNSIKLIWKNDDGITFEKNISLDDQFLFTVKKK